MSSSLEAKVIVVTGGAAGVGRGITLAAAARGATVVIASRGVEAGRATASALHQRGAAGEWRRCDVTRPHDVADLVDWTLQRYARLDAIVHNATAGCSSEPTNLATVTRSEWDAHAAVALRGAYHLARLGYEPLVASQGSFLILTSTTAFEGNAKLPLYATVKGAQRGFVRGLAREWGPHGIRVNALVPLAHSPALDRAERRIPGLAAHNRARPALGRLGDPERDIGPAAAFLLSEDARYVTGQTLLANGGALMP